MATKSSKVRVLTANPTGLAKWLEREAETMHPMQFFREAVENEIEAGANKIVIDGFKSDKQGLLTRVSGNGSGMSHDKLISYLSTIMKTDKGDANFGVGARIAALPRNPAGVTFASRTASGDEGMVMLVKQGQVFGLKNWEVERKDADGDTVTTQEEVILPENDELANVKDHGTAVILHGNGKMPTWDSSEAYKVHAYLARRYYQFPGEVVVTIKTPSGGGGGKVVPFGQLLADHSTTNGEVPFKDVSGLSGVIFWWLIPPYDEMKKSVTGANILGASGIGLVVDDEIFDFSQSHMTDFGIQYRSVQNRVAILVGVWDAKMDTSRTSVVYPTGKANERRNTPWKAIGAHFSEHMPKEIDELMSKVIPTSSIFSEDAAKKLDPDWMKWIKPVSVVVPKKDADPLIGDENGEAVPKGETLRGEGPVDPGPKPKPSAAAHRQMGGNKEPGVSKPKVVTPQVKFVPQEEMPEEHPHIMWVETSNTVMISEAFPPYVREVQRWIEKTDHPKSLVETAIRQAYSIEYAAYIIDANSQRAVPLTPEDIETLKGDLALYAKALSCQSLTEMISNYLKTVIKSA